MGNFWVWKGELVVGTLYCPADLINGLKVKRGRAPLLGCVVCAALCLSKDIVTPLAERRNIKTVEFQDGHCPSSLLFSSLLLLPLLVT